jgi:hypothetical protein
MSKLRFCVTENSTRRVGNSDVLVLSFTPTYEVPETKPGAPASGITATGSNQVTLGGSFSVTLTNHPQAADVAARFPYLSCHDDLSGLADVELLPAAASTTASVS